MRRHLSHEQIQRNFSASTQLQLRHLIAVHAYSCPRRALKLTPATAERPDLRHVDIETRNAQIGRLPKHCHSVHEGKRMLEITYEVGTLRKDSSFITRAWRHFVPSTTIHLRSYEKSRDRFEHGHAIPRADAVQRLREAGKISPTFKYMYLPLLTLLHNFNVLPRNCFALIIALQFGRLRRLARSDLRPTFFRTTALNHTLHLFPLRRGRRHHCFERVSILSLGLWVFLTLLYMYLVFFCFSSSPSCQRQKHRSGSVTPPRPDRASHVLQSTDHEPSAAIRNASIISGPTVRAACSW